MAQFNLSILTPEGSRYNGTAEHISAKGMDGYFGVLADHAPMIAALDPGVVTVKSEGETSFFAVGDGVVEVDGKNSVLVLADNAEAADSVEAASNRSAELAKGLQAE